MVFYDQIIPIHIRSALEFIDPGFVRAVERHKPPKIRFDFDLGTIYTDEFEFVSGFDAIPNPKQYCR